MKKYLCLFLIITAFQTSFGQSFTVEKEGTAS